MLSARWLSPKSTPNPKVTLLPRPRAGGTSPSKLQSNSKGEIFEFEKKAWAASSTILGRGIGNVLEPLTRRTWVPFHNFRATPRQSNPGPRFVVDAGT